MRCVRNSNRRAPDSTIAIQAELADVAALPALWKSVLRASDGSMRSSTTRRLFSRTPVGEATAAQWDELFASNARAPFFLAQAAAAGAERIAGMHRQHRRHLCRTPLARHPIYTMAKAALAMMTSSLARELAPDVRVNGVAPGAILWPDNGQTQSGRPRRAHAAQTNRHAGGNREGRACS